MYKWLVSLCLFASFGAAKAQGRLLLDEEQARKNLLVSKAPVVAKEARRSGKVVLLVQIGPDGRVTSAKVDTGPTVLRDPALDAVKQWRFKPFTVHEEKVTASTKLTIDFGAPAAVATLKAPPPATPKALPPPAVAVATPTPPPVDQALQQFQATEEQCRTLVAAHAEPAEQAKACRAAADQSKTLTSANRFLLQRSADVYAATALMRTDDLKLAVAYGTKAIQVVAEGHDDDSGASAAYTVRGQARAFAGDLPGADADLTKAEAFERMVVTAAAGKAEEPSAHAALKNLLLFHAQLLKALKQTDKAQAKTAEAAAL